MQMHCSAPPVVGPNPLPDFNYVVPAMEGVDCMLLPRSIHLCRDELVNGWGRSFSAGGPGKGMYSQLYLNVLNRYHSVYSVLAQNFSMSDAGLFCLFGMQRSTIRCTYVAACTIHRHALRGKAGSERACLCGACMCV